MKKFFKYKGTGISKFLWKINKEAGSVKVQRGISISDYLSLKVSGIKDRR